MKPITRLSRVLLAGTAVLALAGPASIGTGDSGLAFIQPASAANVQIDIFYDRLSGHGSWYDHHRHGYVFIPAVDPGWRPYTHGHWIYTDAGWYWESDEPFAWAVYHYGRWGYDPAFGWYWVPGNVWGPAWVSWRSGGDHIGWAPIGPSGDGYVYGTPDYYEPPVVEAWVFVPQRRFVAVDIHRYVAPVVEINIFLGRARERHHVRYRDGRVYNPFLPRERVTKIVNKEVNIYNITNVESPDRVRRRGDRDRNRDDRTIRTFRADIDDKKPDKKPKRVASSPDEIEKKPKLEQTAKGKAPEDAPPSVAELKEEDSARDRRGKDRDRAEDGDRKRGESDKAERKQDEDKPGKAAKGEKGDKSDKAAESEKGDGEKAKQAERKQDKDKPEKAAKGEKGDKSEKAAESEKGGGEKAKQAERKQGDGDKPKAAAKPEQREREKAEPKADERKQKSREASGKESEQPKGERRGNARGEDRQQKQKQAKPDREPQRQKQARPEREPQQQKQAKPKREPQQQKQSKPEPKREARPQRESRRAPQQAPRQAPPQARERQARPPQAARQAPKAQQAPARAARQARPERGGGRGGGAPAKAQGRGGPPKE